MTDREIQKLIEELNQDEKDRQAMISDQIRKGCDKCSQWDSYFGCNKCMALMN